MSSCSSNSTLKPLKTSRITCTFSGHYLKRKGVLQGYWVTEKGGKIEVRGESLLQKCVSAAGKRLTELFYRRIEFMRLETKQFNFSSVWDYHINRYREHMLHAHDNSALVWSKFIASRMIIQKL